MIRRYRWALVSILAVVAACGDGGTGDDSTNQQPASVSTLAYVVTQCRVDTSGATVRQSLQIRQGDRAPITVVEHVAAVPPTQFLITCDMVGRQRQGPLFAEFGVFRRLGVSPDGTQVVFEVTDEVPPEGYPRVLLLFPSNSLPAEQKGIFVVDADGTGLRRVGPASSVPSFYLSFFAFSPSGRTIAYNDHGPDSENRNAVQIVTLDLVTGERRQVTQLPPRGAGAAFSDTYEPFFNDDQTITFYTHANPDGQHPLGENIVATVHTDGTGLTVAAPLVALPGSEVLTSFRITGSELDAAVLLRPGTPVNPGPNDSSTIQEVFDIDRDNNVLQLTNFGRVDTFASTVSADRQRVLFTASADPFGTNPTKNCQVFSIDRIGSDLRQLTNFREVPEGQESTAGCSFLPRPNGCVAAFTGRDALTDEILFYSSCDPFGTNSNGSQVFAIQSDGTGLRQLTETHGYTEDASRNGLATGSSASRIVELPFPFAWPGFNLRNQVPY